MPDPFLIMALVFLVICALLYCAPRVKLLNFVDYGTDADVVGTNRYAAVRLLIPVIVTVACSCIAARRPDLMVPLLFLIPLSVLGAVVWIGAGISRLRSKAASANEP